MALYTNIYPTLKAADAVNTAAIVAAAVQAAEWRSEMVYRFCKLISADPTEVDGIVRLARDHVGTPPWFVGF